MYLSSSIFPSDFGSGSKLNTSSPWSASPWWWWWFSESPWWWEDAQKWRFIIVRLKICDYKMCPNAPENFCDYKNAMAKLSLAITSKMYVWVHRTVSEDREGNTSANISPLIDQLAKIRIWIRIRRLVWVHRNVQRGSGGQHLSIFHI